MALLLLVPRDGERLALEARERFDNSRLVVRRSRHLRDVVQVDLARIRHACHQLLVLWHGSRLDDFILVIKLDNDLHLGQRGLLANVGQDVRLAQLLNGKLDAHELKLVWGRILFVFLDMRAKQEVVVFEALLRRLNPR